MKGRMSFKHKTSNIFHENFLQIDHSTFQPFIWHVLTSWLPHNTSDVAKVSRGIEFKRRTFPLKVKYVSQFEKESLTMDRLDGLILHENKHSWKLVSIS